MSILSPFHVLANDSMFEITTFDAFDGDDEARLFEPGRAVLVDLDESVENPCVFAFKAAMVNHALPHGWTAVVRRKEFDGYKAPGTVAILIDVGSESDFYLTGEAISITSIGPISVIMLDDIYSKTALELGIPKDQITRAEY